MPTQLQHARNNKITPEMEAVAQKEGINPEKVREEVAEGRLVIPANKSHKPEPMCIGGVAGVKVNANIGASKETSGPTGELSKLHTAVEWGADTVMDLSTGRSDLDEIRMNIIQESRVPVGTVPIYQALDEADSVEDITPEHTLDVIEKQAEQGVDYMTIHAGVLQKHIPLTDKRVTGIVSRGGSILAQWMREHEKENFLYTHFDEICRIFRKHDVTFSLGDGLRPGSINDSSDAAQFAELETLGGLTREAWSNGCQVMVEGPGHIPLNEIEMQVERQKEVCDDAPFYTLGPLVTDFAPGHDHMTSMIGAAVIGWHGADMLCYVTPKEHLGLPSEEDVRKGLTAYKIAAHAADIARGNEEARKWDRELSKARFAFDWQRQLDLALDPETAKEHHSEANSEENYNPDSVKFCSMCGPEFCSMRITQDARQLGDVDELSFEVVDNPVEVKRSQAARYP